MPGSVTTSEDLARLLKVIADETRLRILGLLAEAELSGKELGERLGLTAPTVSHHMRKLVDAGIAISKRDAQKQMYSLNSELLLAARKVPGDTSGTPQHVRPDDERSRILRNFFDGPRLKNIPAQRKQRVLVLQLLLERFEPERQYEEREVNDILRTAHEDVATLRRELVDYGYMVRERGIYRIPRSLPRRSTQVAQEISGDEVGWLQGILQTSMMIASRETQETPD